MFIELVDALRCPVPHEESWLVAATGRMKDRHIVDGTLGCPVCQATYPIRDGTVDMRGDASATAESTFATGEDAGLRLAALLDLADASGFALLLGAWGGAADAVMAHAECPLLLVDPPGSVRARTGISIVRTAGAVPIAAGAARAVALDLPVGDEASPRIASAVRAVRQGGRIVGPVALALPAGATELARDATAWVAEREPMPSPPVTLHVRRGVVGAVQPPEPRPPAGS